MDNAPDIVTVSFAGCEYTGRRLTADQISALGPARDDTSLTLTLFEAMARYAFGEEAHRQNLVERAAGTATVESFVKLMVKFMEASMADQDNDPAADQQDTAASA